MQKKEKKAYEKTVWEDRKTIISANLLNKIEDQLVALDTNVVDLDSQVKSVEHENNKQNFYINALYNENINGRLTVEEENSNNIKLKSNKQGLVEVEKIIGNTLVNRISEPMRELTLNGNIDAEGTFVTTTEGADNGLVDVMCEGNTLVNLAVAENFNKELFTMDGCKFNLSKNGHKAYGQLTIPLSKLNLFKSQGKYKVIVSITKNTLVEEDGTQRAFELHSYNYGGYAIESSTQGYYSLRYNIGEVGMKECIITMKDFNNPSNPIDVQTMIFRSSYYATSGELEGYIIICEYNENQIYPTQPFDGIKSVGECVDGNHKIEIVSNNKNLSPVDIVNPQKWSGDAYNHKIADIRLKPNTTYSISNKYIVPWNMRLRIYYNDGRYIEMYGNDEKHFTTNNSTKYWLMAYDFGQGQPITDIQIEEADEATSFVPHASNKKEILLNEPLRGFTNEIKDKPVKIDGKWFIERNCAELDMGTVNWNLYDLKDEFPDVLGFYMMIDNINTIPFPNNAICNVLPNIKCSFPGVINHNIEGINVHSNYIKGSIYKSKLSELTRKGLNDYFTKMRAKIVYPLRTPIYEPLEITPELFCYNEATHISNDSIIPCNMVVKNTGFSCRALTSDGTYTVVHNGGEGITSKVDTTDNMVRLHGKGKKISDVMVLDGEVPKTYGSFEGMKSTFEDKLVTQEMVDNGLEKAENLGKYKVDLKVIGKNKFNCKFEIGNIDSKGINTTDGYQEWVRTINFIDLVIFNDINNFKVSYNQKLNINNIRLWFYDNSYNFISHKNITETRPSNAKYMRISLQIGNDPSVIANPHASYNVQLEESSVTTPYEPYKEYKTSVYLNSPPLKGDEIVWKEDGLYHYHKTNKETFTKSSIKSYGAITGNSCVRVNFNTKLPIDKNNTNSIKCTCDKLVSVGNLYLHGHPDRTIGKSIGITEDGYLRAIFTFDNIGVGNDSKNIGDKINDWLEKNKPTIIYDIAEPYYEKISDDKLLLEIPDNATLHIDTIIPCQNIKASYTGNLPSVYKLENDISIIEDHNIDIVATTFDMDYRLLEFGWMLEDAGIAGIDLLSACNTTELKNKTLSRYEQAKIIIIGKAHDKETLTRQLTRYLEKGIITKTEYDELIALMKISK